MSDREIRTRVEFLQVEVKRLQAELDRRNDIIRGLTHDRDQLQKRLAGPEPMVESPGTDMGSTLRGLVKALEDGSYNRPPPTAAPTSGDNRPR